MRKVGLWLGALFLGAGLFLFVLKPDNSVPKRGTHNAERGAEEWKIPRLLNWSNAVTRFAHATEVSRVLTNAARNRILVEIVKTRSKFPFIRVETPFRFD